MTQSVALTAQSFLVLEGPQECFEGDQPVYAVTKLNVTTITNDATLVMYVYKNGTDKTSTFTTGSMRSTGNVAVTKTFTNLRGGDELFVTLRGYCDGIYYTFAAFWLRVRSLSGKK